MRSVAQPEIAIRCGHDLHECPLAFGGLPAHLQRSPDGSRAEVHFNVDVDWSRRDLRSIASQQIGHALGISLTPGSASDRQLGQHRRPLLACSARPSTYEALVANISPERLPQQFSWTADLTQSPIIDAKSAIRSAMQTWAAAAEVDFPEDPNGVLRIRWGHNAHNCAYSFDGSLAHTFAPGSGPYAGQIHLNLDADWSQHDLFSVILHELGHALGLSHIGSKDAVMYPFYQTVQRLGWPDIVALMDLYPTHPEPGAPMHF